MIGKVIMNKSQMTLGIKALVLGVLAIAACGRAADDRVLWYTKPGQVWGHEALPIGNARLGAMFFGGVEKEVIQFNEQSLWAGQTNYNGGFKPGYDGFGNYLNFGELTIQWSGLKLANASGYRRALDLRNGIHTVAFSQAGVAYVREGFASRAGQVIVLRYSADKPGALSGSVGLAAGEDAKTAATGNEISFAGQTPNRLRYAAAARLLATGGKVAAEGGELRFENCDSLMILLAARTDYKPDYRAGWRGDDPALRIANDLAQAAGRGFDALRSAY